MTGGSGGSTRQPRWSKATIIAPKSTAALLKAVRAARANPYIMFNVPGRFPLSADDVIRMFRDGLMARCNRGMPSVEGRYEIEDWRHDQRVIQDAHRRIRRSGRNILRIPALKVKYPHIDNYVLESA